MSAQDILNQVTGSDAQLGAALAGTNILGPDIEFGGITGLDASGLQALPSLPGIGDSASASDTSSAGVNSSSNVLSPAAQLIQSVAGGKTGGAWDFFTDIPRLGTTVIGIGILFAGVWSLTKTNPFQIIDKAIPAGSKGSTEVA